MVNMGGWPWGSGAVVGVSGWDGRSGTVHEARAMRMMIGHEPGSFLCTSCKLRHGDANQRAGLDSSSHPSRTDAGWKKAWMDSSRIPRGVV